MKTQKVKALDLLKYPLPMIIKGVRGVYEVTKVVAENDRVTCYRTASHGSEIATLRKPYDGEFEVILTEPAADHLLETIGTLHTRNKGLQKGHATLTRQVRELEEELALTKQQLLSASGTAFAVAGGEVWINNSLLTEKSFSKTPWSDRAVDAIIADVLKDDSKHLEKLKPKPTAADHQLADDIYSLRRRIACDLHDWSKTAEPVLSRLAAAEHAIKLHNQMRRSGK